MRIAGILLIVGGLALSAGCTDEKSMNAMLPVGEAIYDLTFTATWSATTHPENFPGNPHFSSLAGATHSAAVSFWSVGELATTGIKNVAEGGNPGVLLDEVADAIDAGTAEFSLLGGGIGTSPGTVSMAIAVNGDHPLVTLVSMIAPSPDWFVGVNGLNLGQNGAWIDSHTVDLFLYDAGTDDGEDYTSANAVTDPPEPIARIEGYPALVQGEIRPVGTFTFVRR
ncbi:MAG TPA: spondin domain-containing protein [Acidobacteriota bacterium]|nr:spondin domain-containing protein [Acidobacteriota bacterium]